MWDVESGNVSFLRMRNGEWPCGMLGVSHRSRGATQMPFGVLLSKNTDITDAHGWVFSRILYSCSAAYRLVFDAPSAQRNDADFFASGKLCGRMSHDGLAWYAKNLWKSARSVGDK